MGLVFVIIWMLIGLTFLASYFIAKKIHKTLLAKNNQYALAISVGVFVVTLAILGFATLFILANTLGFGR
jgi:hypothetical protein